MIKIPVDYDELEQLKLFGEHYNAVTEDFRYEREEIKQVGFSFISLREFHIPSHKRKSILQRIPIEVQDLIVILQNTGLAQDDNHKFTKYSKLLLRVISAKKIRPRLIQIYLRLLIGSLLDRTEEDSNFKSSMIASLAMNVRLTGGMISRLENKATQFIESKMASLEE